MGVLYPVKAFFDVLKGEATYIFDKMRSKIGVFLFLYKNLKCIKYIFTCQSQYAYDEDIRLSTCGLR